MSDIGKSIIGFGLLLVVVGAVVMLAGRLGIHRLPGDFVVRRGGFTGYFPIATCLLLSVVMTIILNLVFRRR